MLLKWQFWVISCLCKPTDRETTDRETYCSLWTLGVSINFNTGTSLWRRMSIVGSGSEEYMGTRLPSAQLCCEPKSALLLCLLSNHDYFFICQKETVFIH